MPHRSSRGDSFRVPSPQEMMEDSVKSAARQAVMNSPGFKQMLGSMESQMLKAARGMQRRELATGPGGRTRRAST